MVKQIKIKYLLEFEVTARSRVDEIYFEKDILYVMNTILGALESVQKIKTIIKRVEDKPKKTKHI